MDKYTQYIYIYIYVCTWYVLYTCIYIYIHIRNYIGQTAYNLQVGHVALSCWTMIVDGSFFSTTSGSALGPHGSSHLDWSMLNSEYSSMGWVTMFSFLNPELMLQSFLNNDRPSTDWCSTSDQQTMLNYIKPYQTILNYIKPYQTILNHCKPNNSV